jgi:hypothetical protein
MSARGLTLTALVIVISGAGLSPSASAAAIARGSLVAGGGNDSGRTTTQVASCKKKTRVCKLSQKLWIADW